MRGARLTFAIVYLAVITAGCANINSDNASSTSNPAIVSTTVNQSESLESTFVPTGYDTLVTDDGRTRTYRVVDLSESESAPLLFVLHGFGGTAEGMRAYAGIEAAVQSTLQDGAIVVYPNGSGLESGLPQSWNAGGCCPFSIYEPVDDVSFFEQMIDRLSAAYDVDAERVWVVGHSNGGMMAYRLACELSTRVTAIGVAAGALMIDTCSPSSGVSALHLHGALDNVVPLDGGDIAGITFPSARDSFERFAIANRCSVNDVVAECPAGLSIALQTDTQWAHDWLPAWTTALIDFLARESGS